MDEDGAVAVRQVGEPLAHVGRDVRVDEGDLLDAKRSADAPGRVQRVAGVAESPVVDDTTRP